MNTTNLPGNLLPILGGFTAEIATFEKALGREARVGWHKCICEADGDGWKVTTPDGNVQGATTKAAAEQICQAYFEAHRRGDINVGEIEWR